MLYDPRQLPSYVAELEGEPVGLLTFHDAGPEREVVTVDAVRRGIGVARSLLRAAAQDARREGIRRMWLVTTNDNTTALRVFQRAGWDLVALHRDAVARARELKPSIPMTGDDGISMRHELELELRLDG